MHTSRRATARKDLPGGDRGRCMSGRGAGRAIHHHATRPREAGSGARDARADSSARTATHARERTIMDKKLRRQLDRLRLPELQQRFREVVGEATRCPNRTFLVRRIAEALASGNAAPTRPAKAPANGAQAKPAKRRKGATAAATKPARGRFTTMSVEDLQAAYASTVGRPTGSTDRRYLVWKIREAEKGRVPIGPRATRTPDQQAATDTRILPLRLGNEAVEALDAAWRGRGMKSRTELLRRALGHYLRHVGDRAAAAHFAEP